MGKLSILKELADYIKLRKKLWLFPVLFFIILLSLFLAFAQTSAVAPFIYTLF